MKTIYNEDKTRTIYEILNKYSKTQIDNGISELSIKEQNFLYFRSDGDLENHYINPDFPKEYEKYFYFLIVPRIKENILKQLDNTNHNTKKTKPSELKTKNMNKVNKVVETKPLRKSRNLKTIYQICDKFPRELVDEVLSELNEKDKNLLFLMNGNDLDNPVREKNIDAKTKNAYQTGLIQKIKRRLEKKKMMLDKEDEEKSQTISLNSDKIEKDYEELKKYIINELKLDAPEYHNLINNLTGLEIEAIYLKIQDLSSKQISKKLGISITEVTQLIKDFYNSYRDIYLNSLKEQDITKKLLK